MSCKNCTMLYIIVVCYISSYKWIIIAQIIFVQKWLLDLAREMSSGVNVFGWDINNSRLQAPPGESRGCEDTHQNNCFYNMLCSFETCIYCWGLGADRTIYITVYKQCCIAIHQRYRTCYIWLHHACTVLRHTNIKGYICINMYKYVTYKMKIHNMIIVMI